MKRINVALDPKAHKRAKVIASLLGMTLNEYLAKALADSVKGGDRR